MNWIRKGRKEGRRWRRTWLRGMELVLGWFLADANEV